MRAKDAVAWDRYVAAANGNFLQTTLWGQLKGAFGWEWELVTAGHPRRPEGGALMLYRGLPLRLGKIAYVPRGPVIDWNDHKSVAEIFFSLEYFARNEHAWALWVEPELPDTPENRAQLTALGLRESTRTVQPPRTIHIDLSGSEEEILARMKSKTRYNIRLAERKGVTVRKGSKADVETFYGLMTETGERDEFGIHSAEYYRQALSLPKRHSVLLLAEVAGAPVAGLIAFALGKTAWYFYGASSQHHREKMPTYALQWEAIRWARSRGCTRYDLWGIPDADEETLEAEFTERSDGLWGVYRFKRGFGGEVVRYVGLWEKSLHPLYPLARGIQRRLGMRL